MCWSSQAPTQYTTLPAECRTTGAAHAVMGLEAVSQAVGCAVTRLRKRSDQRAALIDSMECATFDTPTTLAAAADLAERTQAT